MAIKKKASRVLAMIEAQQWLISEEWLQTIATIASRENDLDSFRANKALLTELNDPAALLTSHDGVIAGTNSLKRDNWAIIPVMGPIFPRANMFTEMSGGASIEMIARDTRIAISKGLDPLLYISSPGGVVEGVSEYGQMLAGTNAIAFVSGNCTSAAYWLASQCQSIMVSDTAVIGNIGVKGPNPKSGDDDSIISEHAPNKKLTAGMVKGIVNDIEAVFLQAVASGRGTTVDDVKANFGKGGVFVGEKAVYARLADGVTTLEALLSISANQARTTQMAMTEEEIQAHAATVATLQAQLDAANTKAATAEAALKDEPEQAERMRICAIIESAPDKPIAAMTMAMKTSLNAEEAISALASMPVEAAMSTNDPLAAAMGGTNPLVGDDAAGDQDNNESQAAIDASWDAISGAAA